VEARPVSRHEHAEETLDGEPHLEAKSGRPVIAVCDGAVKEAQNPAVDDRISWRRQLSWLHFKVEVVVAAEDTVVDPGT